MNRRNPYKGVNEETHRNALSKQEYRPGQQNTEIKSLVALKRRNVGETSGGKLFEYILPLFLIQYAKKSSRSATCEGRGRVNQRLVKISRGNQLSIEKWRPGSQSTENCP